MNKKSSSQLLHLLFLVFLCISSAVDGSSSSSSRVSPHARHRRSISEFGDMIRRATQREALLYNNYGNHCGFQGGDEPVVDEVDRCCWSHDRCYIAVEEGACSSSWLGPNFVRYSWSWNGTHLACGADNDACRAAACDCDATAATCFSRHPWNAENKKSSIWDILA